MPETIYRARFMTIPFAARGRWPQSSLAWLTCPHRFVPYFGPALHCRLCGASTMVSMDARESKPIFPPSVLDE